jgi:hypothetical protein
MFLRRRCLRDGFGVAPVSPSDSLSVSSCERTNETFFQGETKMAAEKNQPVHQYRLGKIVGTVWFNDDDNGRGRHTVSITRLYKPNDEDGWQRSTSFGRDDLPLVAKVADSCHTWIHEIWQRDRYYAACSSCTAKWFSKDAPSACPRCGCEQVSVTRETPPWSAKS